MLAKSFCIEEGIRALFKVVYVFLEQSSYFSSKDNQMSAVQHSGEWAARGCPETPAHEELIHTGKMVPRSLPLPEETKGTKNMNKMKSSLWEQRASPPHAACLSESKV